MKRVLLLLLPLLLLSAQSIEEKMASLQSGSNGLSGEASERLERVNQQISRHRRELQKLFAKVDGLYRTKAMDQNYIDLLDKINQQREAIRKIEQQWRDWSIDGANEEAYALWHQPWTTLEQLIMDYGSQDFVYLIPPEVRTIQVSLTSNLPIPRESWDEMLGLILTQNGVGIRQLGPFLRQLYLVNFDQGSLSFITDSRDELGHIPPSGRVCFVLTPAGPDLDAVHEFLSRFLDATTSAIYAIGGQLFILSSTEGVEQLLKLYDFVEASCGKREYALIPLNQIKAEEMASIIELYFSSSAEPDFYDYAPRGPKIMALPNLTSSLFVAGTAGEVEQARELCAELEAQVESPQAMVIHWYRCKHSEPEALAEIMAQVYGLLIGDPIAATCTSLADVIGSEINQLPGQCPVLPCVPTYDPAMIAVQPPPVTTRQPPQASGAPQRTGNFITDPKTGTIIMVVHQAALPQLKCLLKRLDIPKKMVQIDVLLIEKKIKCESRFGLDLLRMGDAASDLNRTSLRWDNRPKSKRRGILSFLFSQEKTRAFPAYDILYNFLMAQQDMRINANPSVTTVNQTPATIRLVEEISLNMGTFIDPDTPKSILGRSFTRAQYGITLNITPTINLGVEEESGGMSPSFITLNTDVLFDTPQSGIGEKDDQPRVLRRQVNNQVRIEDGQTVILGGLRSKISEDGSTSLPFLGELPGIGKLFSSTQMRDDSTEMFIFITPHIVHDAEEEMRTFLCRRLRERPGDLPEYLQALEEARCYQQNRSYCRTLQIVFGQPKNYFCCD